MGPSRDTTVSAPAAEGYDSGVSPPRRPGRASCVSSLAPEALHHGDGATPRRRQAGLICAVVALLTACCGGASGNPVPGTWHTESSGTRQSLYGVACLDDLRCEAVGAAGTILATADGGRTWQAQPNPLQGSSTELYSIACVAPSSCYAVGRPDTILVTHDGGATWTSHLLPIGVSGSDLTDTACLPQYTPISGRSALCRLGLLDIACLDAGRCYAVATTPAAYGTNTVPRTATAASSVWMTGDGGVTWSQQPLPPGVACDGDCNGSLYPYPLVWISCPSGGPCRAGGSHVICGHCGFAYAVLVARDPAMAWACVEAAAPCTGLAPDAADCPDSTTCYGVQSTNPFGNENTVFQSTDGGDQWTQVGSNWGTSVLNAISCPSTSTCYVAGTAGSVAQVAGATSLSAESTPTRSDLHGIACTGTSTCIAVGDQGTILTRS